MRRADGDDSRGSSRHVEMRLRSQRKASLALSQGELTDQQLLTQFTLLIDLCVAESTYVKITQNEAASKTSTTTVTSRAPRVRLSCQPQSRFDPVYCEQLFCFRRPTR